MESPPISEAFVCAAEKFFRRFGKGPYDGLRTIGDTYGKGWAMIANTTPSVIDSVQPFSILIFRNGLPYGIIDPFGGTIISVGEPGKSESEFIDWCREDEAVSSR